MLSAGKVDNLSLRHTEWLVLSLAVLMVLFWQSPPLRILHGADIMPLWLHVFAETVSIVVAMLIFGVSWNAYSKDRPGNIIILACAFLAVGLIDFAHTISFNGMPDFITPAGREKAINFWLSGQFVVALALFVVALRPWRPLPSSSSRYRLLAGSLAVTAVVYWFGLFHQALWPRTFIEGEGLTSFKIAAEYTIIAILFVAAVLFYTRARKSQAQDAGYLFAAVAISILSELCFTLYSDVTDAMNLLGHIYKDVAYLFLYRIIFVSSVREPFRKLHQEVLERKQAEEALRQSEAKLQTLYDSTSDAVMLLDEKGFFDCNKATLAIFGCATKEEFYSMRLAELSPPEQPCGTDSVALSKQRIATAMEKGRHFFEWVHQRADTGKAFPADVLINRMELDGTTVLQATVRDITERRRNEKALVESEGKFRRLFEDAADPVLLLKNGHFIDCNTATLKLLGYDSKAVFINRSPSEMSPPYQPDGFSSAEKFAEMVAAALREGYSYFEWTHVRLDGSAIPVEVTFTRITVDGEPILHVLWRDITERKKIEDRLRTLSLVVEQSPNSIIITDLGANIEYVNQAFLAETGYSLDEVVGKNSRLLNSGKNPLSAYREMWECLIRGERWKGELVNRRKDGSEYIESMLISPVFLKEGGGAHYVSIKENITERIKNQAKIERLSRVYHLLSKVNETIVRAENRNTLFAAICDAAAASDLFRFVWIGLLDEEKIGVTPVAYSGFEEGYTNKLYIRLDDERTSNGPTARAIRNNTHMVIQNIEHDPFMAPWRNAALERGYRASCVMPIHEAGVVVGTINVYAAETDFFTPDIVQLMLELAADISFSLDVFAEKERCELAENGIRRMNLELEQRVVERTLQLELANKELEAFSYSVSHDLRAPLRSIDGFSQVLLQTYCEKFDAKGRDYLERVRRASQRMGELIDDMLSLSQVTRSEIRKEPVDLSQMARQIAANLKESAPERQVEFVIAEDLRVKADAKLLRIAMENLLGNAWKFTARQPEAKIELGVVEQIGIGVIFVRDDGAGFNMDYAHKLFNPFQRLHGVKDFEGTGIGLATVHRIIQRHGGRIWAEAREGLGATFFFTCAEHERESG